jgi:uncharacterized membrane protein YfcA
MTPFIIICASIGYAAESIFGFGGSVVTYLLLIQMLSAKEAVVLLPVFALAGSLFILISDWAAVKWVVIRKVSLLAIPGLAAGALLMERLGEDYLAAGVLLIILIYGISLIAGKNPAVPKNIKNPLYLFSGFIMGATSLGVLFVPVVSAELGDRRSFRASLALLWFLTALVRVLLYIATGVLTPRSLLDGVWSYPFLLLAIYVGFAIHKKIPEASYKRYVGFAIAGISMINFILMFINSF